MALKEGAPTPIATEQGRFNVVVMAQSLTTECARKFKKLLLTNGGDSVTNDLETGRAYHEVSDAEVHAQYEAIPAHLKRVE
jgi:hypothetical protein